MGFLTVGQNVAGYNRFDLSGGTPQKDVTVRRLARAVTSGRSADSPDVGELAAFVLPPADLSGVKQRFSVLG